MLKPLDYLVALLILSTMLVPWDGCGVVAPTKATAVVYTFEKDQTAVPSAVRAAINTLNRRGIVATEDEVDSTDGDAQVPDQYKVSRPAAVAAGLPALVVLAGDKVLKVVKDPRTDAAVLEAAP